ncbi:MAG: hypothetical protein ACYDDO_12735 [Acidiferrobacterales bacterium]
MARYKGCDPFVLAIPRDAVWMARLNVDVVDGEMGVVLVCKIGAPHSPKFAAGILDQGGRTFVAG